VVSRSKAGRGWHCNVAGAATVALTAVEVVQSLRETHLNRPRQLPQEHLQSLQNIYRHGNGRQNSVL
jgi:hypothetical protein